MPETLTSWKEIAQYVGKGCARRSSGSVNWDYRFDAITPKKKAGSSRSLKGLTRLAVAL
jgi:hypothetical protein